MVGPLLDTKLHIPRRRSGLVARPRLHEQLRRASESALALVSAPAGFGKTTLLTEWLAAAAVDGRSVAWISLDERDNDPVTFWTYVVAALRTAAEQEACGRASAVLESSQPSIEALLAALLADLEAIPDDVVLVLDDFHVLESRDVHDGIAFLVEHLPARVHLVIASRADPPLPLGRLRAAGELVEIRAAELRFSSDESAQYLNEVRGLGLAASEVEALRERTEGWVAALQLAALSMKGRSDLAEFIAGFAGDDRYIVDYLVEEVLGRQQQDVREFLLRTCVLERMTGSLCDAVTGQRGGKAMLEALERDNLFVVPLDDRRRWYRYHHLFADVLQAHLADEQADTVACLHRRASEWYERHGEPTEAIRHALVAEDYERTAELMERALPALRRSRQESVIRGWVDVLPEELLRVRPVLTIGLVGGLAASNELDKADRLLRLAERWLGTITGVPEASTPERGEIVVVDHEELRFLPGSIEMYRAAQALGGGDLPGTVEHARRAIDLAPGGDNLPRAGGTAFLGLASWAGGDLVAAEAAYADSMAMLERAGHDADVLGCALALADIRVGRGHLGEAIRTYERGLAHGQRNGRVLRGTLDMHVGLSELHRERGDLPTARDHLRRGKELGEHAGLPQHPYRWRVAEARIRQVEQDLDGALDLLDEANRVYIGDYAPNVRPVPALRARLHVARGDLDRADAWRRDSGVAMDDEPGYLREFEHVTLARLLLARYAGEQDEHVIDDAVRLLGRLLPAAEQGGRTGSVIEILVVQASAHHLRGDRDEALGCLRRAVALAEPEGYVGLFVDEGPPMARLLRTLSKQAAAPRHLGRLQAAMADPPSTGTRQHALVDRLSERELEVLRLLGTDLSGPDIARELVVSLNTVRTHTKHIYTKLGVGSRRAAVREGERLNLL